jgi:hypothetical protein
MIIYWLPMRFSKLYSDLRSHGIVVQYHSHMPATKFYIRNVTLYVEDLLVVLEELHVDQVMLDPRHTHLSDGEHFF